MTPEQLLKPRYKVIGDYPNSPYKIGHVILSTHCSPLDHYGDYLEKHPHLFKKLEWWEERNVEDMPIYLKGEYDECFTYHKIEKWNSKLFAYTDFDSFQGLDITFDDVKYTPITEQEYIENFE